MGWDDNGLPTERRVQNYFGVRCDPSLPYDPDFVPPAEPAEGPGRHLAPQLRGPLPPAHRSRTSRSSSTCGARLGLSVDWSHTYATIGERARRVSQRGFLRLARRRPGRPAHGAHPVGRRLPHRGQPGRAGGPGAPRRLPPPAVPRVGADGGVEIETTRPELLPACVALVAHPDDDRYRPLFGTEVRHPAVRRAGPGRGPRAGRPREGLGHRHDLHLRRHHRRGLVARARPAHPHRRRPRRPAAAGRVRGTEGWESDDPDGGRRRLRRAGRPDRQAGPGPDRRAAGRVGRPDRRAPADHPPGQVLREGRPPPRDRVVPPVVRRDPPPTARPCWPGARSCAGTRPTWPTATGPGSRA